MFSRFLRFTPFPQLSNDHNLAQILRQMRKSNFCTIDPRRSLSQASTIHKTPATQLWYSRCLNFSPCFSKLGKSYAIALWYYPQVELDNFNYYSFSGHSHHLCSSVEVHSAVIKKKWLFPSVWSPRLHASPECPLLPLFHFPANWVNKIEHFQRWSVLYKRTHHAKTQNKTEWQHKYRVKLKISEVPKNSNLLEYARYIEPT